jgi:hypothetical protein
VSATPQPQRPEISIVTPDTPPSPPHVPPPSNEPEAQPPGGPPPDDGPTIDLGGPTLPEPVTPEEVVDATGGSVADMMKARFAGMQATEEFPVPGWELEDGSPGLVLVAKTFGDRKGYQSGVSNELFIAKSTHQLLFVDDQGERHPIPGGWGPALAGMIGAPQIKKAADLVARVISKPDPDDESKRIANVAGIATLATDLLGWSRRAKGKAEEELGE